MEEGGDQIKHIIPKKGSIGRYIEEKSIVRE